MKRSYILLLIIYSTFLGESFSQSIYLTIEGSSVAENGIIDSLGYVKTFKDIGSLAQERETFKTKLYKLGYIEAEEISSKRINDSMIHVDYALRDPYKAIHIYHSPESIPKELLDKVAMEVFDDHFSLAFNTIENKLNALNQELANKGAPFKTLQLKNIKKKKGHILRADLFASDDTERRIDNIVVNGYERFPQSFLNHYLKIRTDDPFNLDEIKKRTESLNELSFASQIKPPEVLFTKDSTTLYIYLKKRSSNTFDGFLGFGTNEATNKIEFDGYLNLNLKNNLNYGESLRLLYKSDENEQKTFDGNLELPYLFGSPIGAELQLNIFKKDSSFTTVNQHAKVFYQLNSRSKVLLGVNATQSNNLLNDDSLLLIDDYKSTFYNLGYQYVVKNSSSELFPIDLNVSLQAGNGKRSSDDIDLKQTSLRMNAFKIFELNKKNSIYIRTNGALLFSDDYVFNELYRFGGINSIRGFEENSLFASSYALINTEYRYGLSRSIYINSILDTAYYENEIDDLKANLYGFGFGFGILTNSGLLKFNYANGKIDNQKFKFSNSKIHISLTAQF